MGVASSGLVTDIGWSTDGTKFYVLNNGNDTLYQISCSVPWGFSGNESLSATRVVPQDDIFPYGFHWKPDGTKIYLVGAHNDTVRQYSLGSAWNISNMTFDSGQSVVVSSQSTNPYSVFFTSDGLNMYLPGTFNHVRWYTLSTAWNLTTATYQGGLAIGTYVGTVTNVFVDDTGQFLFASGTTRAVARFTLSTPFNVTTGTYTSSYTSLTSNSPYAITFKPDGTRMYVMTYTDRTVRSYNLA
jgi:sugar lactone lactonase YvrE